MNETAELMELECPECFGISYYGDWEYIKPKTEGCGSQGGLRCPKCGEVFDYV